MAIDHIIDYDCVPKQTLTTNGILERIKGRARAQEIIKLYRDAGDARPPSQMGFQLTRRTAAGGEETEDVIVQSLLDAAEQLTPLEHHCAGCPANRAGKPFGCMGTINYPISGEAEAWLLNRLPTPDDTLVWLLLKRGVDDFLYDGQSIAALRIQGDTYFEDRKAPERRLGEFSIDANQVFEMMFTVGDIIPNHAGILMLFFHVIPRDMDATQIMQITPADADAEQKHPLILDTSMGPDPTINDLEAFFQALYVTWRLNVKMIVDA